MYIVYGHADLFMPYSSSLKEKRSIIQGVVARIRKRYNISISEVAYQDLWQRSVIGFSAVGGSTLEMDKITTAIKETFYNYSDEAEITDFQHDVITVLMNR